MNDENPYASPRTASDGESTPRPTPLPARWRSLRGAVAIVFFVLGAFPASGVLGSAIAFVESGTRIDRVALLGVLLFGVTIGLIMIGFGIRAGRVRVALLGFVVVVGSVAIRLVWGLFW